MKNISKEKFESILNDQVCEKMEGEEYKTFVLEYLSQHDIGKFDLIYAFDSRMIDELKCSIYEAFVELERSKMLKEYNVI